MSDPSYNLSGYGDLIADQVRMDAYDAAMARLCRPGCRVLDLGCGTGILSLLACRHGAGHVYALDFSETIGVAQELADVNGMADRITFIREMSTKVTLPENVDLILTDVRGVLPMTGTSLATMRDARRFLAPGGAIVPCRDVVRVAIIQTESVFLSMANPWRRYARGLNLEPAARLALQAFRKVRLNPSSFLAPPATLFDLDYTTLDAVSHHASSTMIVEQAGVIHGLCAWFDTTFVDEIGFSNGPGAPPAIYGQAFFPLLEPVTVSERDQVTIDMRAAQVHDDYIWTWDTLVKTPAGEVRHRSHQSTFHGAPIALDDLHRSRPQSP